MLYADSNGKYIALLQKEIKTVQGEDNALNNSFNVKQTVYTYDANGNQITKTADGKTETNTYDGLNQLIRFTDGETTASYKYNVSGLRIEKVVNGQRINHVWDGSKQIVADVIEGDTYNANCYIRGTSLAAKYNYRNGERSEYTYYTQNAHGDVVDLTNADGEVVKSYTYDAFGVEKNISDSDSNPFRYCGEYFDAETGTVYLRARYYEPTTGRFISWDSVTGKIEDPLSLNLYTYCHNNPVLNFDPSGHIKCPKWLKDTWDFIKGTAEEIPHYALDLTMGLANSVDEKLAFGTGNKIRENFGIDAYEPYDQSYYNGTYLAGEAFSTVANAYMLADGISALTNAKNIFKGGMSVSKATAGGKAVAGGYSVVVDGSAALRAINGGLFSGWSAGNIMYSKSGGYRRIN